MWNAECGTAVRGSNPTLKFRIPHSAFRISLGRLPAAPAAHDQLRRRLLLVTRLLAFDLAPGRRGRPAARALPLATAQRMVHRVHRYPAHARHAPEPAALACFAHGQQLVLGVPDLADRGEA